MTGMEPQHLLRAAAELTARGDISLRDDPLTHAWRHLHHDLPPDTDLIDRAATHVSGRLGAPHDPEQWWAKLAGRDSFQIAALLAQASTNAAPKGIEA